MHRAGWAVLLGLLIALLAGAFTFDKRAWPVFAGDEATYLMLGESLAWDFDIHYGRGDYDRFLAHWQRPPDGLILQSSDNGATMTYGKPALYSLALAPFLRLSPLRGAAIANALFLAFAACAAAAGLRGAVDDGDRAGVPHPRRTDDPDHSNPCAVVVSRDDEAEGAEVGIQVLGPNDHAQPGAVDVFVQDLEQFLLLLDHLKQRLQHRERQPARVVEQRRGAFDVNEPIVGQV